MAIGETLKKVPTWAWVIIGVVLLIGLFLIVKGKGGAKTPVIPSAAVTDSGTGSGSGNSPTPPATTAAQWSSAQSDWSSWIAGNPNPTASQAYGQWQSIIRRDVPALTGASDAILMTMFNTFNQNSTTSHNPLLSLDSIVAFADSLIGTTPASPTTLYLYNGSGLVTSPVNA